MYKFRISIYVFYDRMCLHHYFLWSSRNSLRILIILHSFAHKFNYSPIVRYARLRVLICDLKICCLTDMFSKMQWAKKREVICIMFVWCILLFISNSMSNQWTFILYLSWHIYHTQSQLQWNKVARNNMQIKFLLFSQRSMTIPNCKL